MASNPDAAARYTPGSWLGVVRSGTVVLLRPDSAAALVESVWELLATGPQVHEVLDAVTSASGGSLARLPWFAIVDSRSAVQFFLRGEIDLTVDLPTGPVELSGREVTTWTERRFATANGFSLTVPGAEASGAAGAGLDLPLTDGVVLLQGLRVEFAGATAETAVLAAAEADIAAGLSDHDASAETVLEFPGEDLELDGTLHEEPEQAPEPEPELEEPEPQLVHEPELEPEPEQEEPEPLTDLEPEPEQEPAEQELTGSYDHLWEQTVMRNIEDAAVREDPDADGEPAAAPASPEPAGPGSASPEPASPESASPEPAGPGSASLEFSSAATPPDLAESTPAPEPPAAPRLAVPAGLIDSVPWLTGSGRPPSSGSSLPSPAPAAPLPPTAPQAHAPQVPVQQVQIPQPPVPQFSAVQPDADADHDGQTIMKSDLVGAAPQPAGAQRGGSEPATGPMVLARVCPQGHANPSTYSHCGRCGEPLPGDGVQVRRPRLGRMRLSTGGLIDLDQSLIVGRQPSVSRVQGAVMPKLVQVASPSGDISRSHVEVRLEGWHVMLCDLKATNGTVLVREGQPPRRLAQGEMAILLDGDIAEVGDGISLRFEEIP